jgi:hypothetical protein
MGKHRKVEDRREAVLSCAMAQEWRILAGAR